MFCNSVNCGFGRKALDREIAQVFERNAAMNDGSFTGASAEER